MSSNHNTNGRSRNEAAPLLGGRGIDGEDYKFADPKKRGLVWGCLTLVFIVALVIVLGFPRAFGDRFSPWFGVLPRDPALAALTIMSGAPVIDGHIDLPALVRHVYANNVSAVDLNKGIFWDGVETHVSIPKLRKGKVGGFFWSTYVSCPEIDDDFFLQPSWRVRDTLEQIDVARELINKYPSTFEFALSSTDIKRAIVNNKIASMLGVEGGHQLGNSIGVLRQYHALGVRYVTLTHVCHNAFADSGGLFRRMRPLHGGLSPLGRQLIDEMNRLGVLVDLSHTSDATAYQALNYSKAPVIWSHSSSRAIHNIPRNVPDGILELIGSGDGQKDGVVMVNFVPQFLALPGKATVEAVADHVDHIAQVAGKRHVGLGSDFDGMESAPDGLEDVSKYPALIAVLYKRGWNKYELAGLTGGNLLRVLEAAERVAWDLQQKGTTPVYDVYDKRTDFPLKGDEL